MKKFIKSHKGRKKLDFLIASTLILALLAISPAAASVSSMQFSSSPDTVHASAQIFSTIPKVLGLEVTLASNESFDPLKYIEQNIDLAYMLAGVGAAILLGFIYTLMIRGENEFITNLRKTLYSFKIRKIIGKKEAVQEKVVSEMAVEGKTVAIEAVKEKVIPKVAVQEKVVSEEAVLDKAVPKEAVQEKTIPGQVFSDAAVHIKNTTKQLQLLLGSIYTRMISGVNEFLANLRKTLNSLKTKKITGNKEAIQEKIVPKEAVQEKVVPEMAVQEKVVPEVVVQKKIVPAEVVHDVAVYEEVTDKQLKLYIAVPVLCITIAELLIFLGKIEIAIWVHIGVLFALSVSNIFIKDPKVHKIHMPLMLLPILRLVNLSMPIFSNITLYTFILYYTPLAIPVAAIIIHQRNSLKEIGITKKHLLLYIVLAVPLSFLLGLGEYLTIRPGYLIPDLSFEHLLVLTIIMVFFVGLVEELIFRSLLQSRLEQALSMPEALLITSFLFGLMHSGYGTYYEMLYTGFVGLIIGLIFYKTRSLPFIAVLHGFVNVFLFGILPLHVIGLSWL